MTAPLTIALNKGRILAEVLPLLARAGIETDEPIHNSRKLVFESGCGRYRLFVLRSADVPTFVNHGVADIGVTGKDTLLEADFDGYYEPLDLGLAQCRLMTAGLPQMRDAGPAVRVATKFERIARRHYEGKGLQVSLIKLGGAMELAPLVGLADHIVDIVDTGNTLRANGLEAWETIAHVSTRAIVNKASFKRRHAEVKALLDRLAGALAAPQAVGSVAARAGSSGS